MHACFRNMTRSSVGAIGSVAVAFLLLSIAQGRSCSGAETDNSKLRAAMLDVNSSPLGALLEQRLLTNHEVQWLERNEIEWILKEQDLSQLLGAAAVSQRVNVGELLKADLLVILKHVDKPEKHADLVVCETGRGLRLLVDSLPTTDDPEADALMLDAWVKQAMRKYREEIKTVVAVPPFVSNNLTSNMWRHFFAPPMRKTTTKVVCKLDHSSALCSASISRIS